MSMWLYRAKWPDSAREAYHKEHPENFAGPDLSFPIKDQNDVTDAWKLAGHADNPDAVRKKIKAIAKRLGLKLPKAATKSKAAKRLMRSNGMTGFTVQEMKPFHLFAPIFRKDPATREVEGIFYTQREVGDGYDLPPETVERMLPGYMKYGTGAIREMHGSSAAGKALQTAMVPATQEMVDLLHSYDVKNVKVGQKVGFVRTKCVDDQAWKKIDEGVYKGFSIGVTPTVLRGKTVKDGLMPEISYVDRPWDEGCAFTAIYRAQGVPDDWARRSVIVRVKPSKNGELDLSDPEQFERAMQAILEETNPELQRMKMKKLRKAVVKIAKVKQTLNGGGIYYSAQPTLTRNDGGGTMPNNGTNNGTGFGHNTPNNGSLDWQARALSAETREQGALQRVRDLEKKLSKVKSKLQRAEGELVVLRRMPASTPPVRFPNGAQRTFEANGFEVGQMPHFGEEFAGEGANMEATVKRYREIINTDPTTLSEPQRQDMAVEVAVLSAQLSDAGVDVAAIS